MASKAARRNGPTTVQPTGIRGGVKTTQQESTGSVGAVGQAGNENRKAGSGVGGRREPGSRRQGRQC